MGRARARQLRGSADREIQRSQSTEDAGACRDEAGCILSRDGSTRHDGSGIGAGSGGFAGAVDAGAGGSGGRGVGDPGEDGGPNPSDAGGGRTSGNSGEDGGATLSDASAETPDGGSSLGDGSDMGVGGAGGADAASMAGSAGADQGDAGTIDRDGAITAGNSMVITLDTTASGAAIFGSVENYPLAISLDSSRFDFSQAAAAGQDIRFEKIE